MNLNLAFPELDTIEIVGETFNFGFTMRTFAIVERETGSITETLSKLENLAECSMLEQLDTIGILLYASLESSNKDFKYSLYEVNNLVSMNNDLDGLINKLVGAIAKAMPKDAKDDEVKNAPKVVKKRAVKK